LELFVDAALLSLPDAPADTVVVPASTGSGPLFCPYCSTGIAWTDIRHVNAIRCSHCDAKLCIPESYRMWNGLYALGVALVISFGLGARGLALVFTTIAAWFPALIGVFYVAHRVLPPKLAFSDDFLRDLKRRN